MTTLCPASREPPGRLSQARPLYRLIRFVARVILQLTCQLRVEGEEWLPPTGPVIIAPNHASYLDPPVVAAAVHREIHFMAKRELFSLPILSWLIPRLNAFPVSRGTPDRKALRHSLALLSKGHAILLFPEGTRSPDGQLLPPDPGVALLALRARVPVVPMAIKGTEKAWPPSRLLPRPAKITVRIGPPLTFPDLPDRAGEREAMRSFAQEVIRAIEALLLSFATRGYNSENLQLRIEETQGGLDSSRAGESGTDL